MQKQITVEEICRKLKPIFGKKIDEIYLKYAMADGREEREEIAHILNALYEKNLNRLLDNSVLLEPPVAGVIDGNYPLALISYAGKKLNDFSLREQDWIRHLCISGMSGSGKTTLGFHIINNFIKKNKPFLIFDWKKSFRPLMLSDAEIMCFTVGNSAISNLFKLNINKPPKDVNPKEWINVLCDLIGESFFTSYGVHKVLLETLDDAYKEYGIYQGSENYPTWNYIKWRLESKLEKSKGREAGWLESALRIASVLTFGDFGKILNYKGKQSISVEELLDKKIIFELNSLGNIEKKFFCEFILTYIYKLKKARQSNSDGSFEHAILVDEAHNIFLKDKTNFVKESVTDMIYREMREYGTCLICLDQHISKLSDTVKGNSACHIAFQQQLPQDIWDISGIMQLNDRKEFFSKLPVGSAIVKLSERYTSPFLIEVEKVDLRKKIVKDKEIKDKMQFVFEGKEIERGEDDFSKLVKGEDVRIPNHSLYNGEAEKVHKLKTNFEDKINEDNSKENLANSQAENIISKNIKHNLKGEDEEGEEDNDNFSNFKNYLREDKGTEIIQEEATQNMNKANKTKQSLNIHQDLDKNIKKENNIQINLTSNQEILFDFIKEKSNQGWNINEIEKFMLDRKEQGEYNSEDVFKAINCFIKEIQLNKNNKVVTLERVQNKKLYKLENNDLIEGKTNELQKRFLAFLQENPNHELATVQLYNEIGLSARKGNKIKNDLLEQGKIKIQEVKYNKGWKKIISLS